MVLNCLSANLKLSKNVSAVLDAPSLEAQRLSFLIAGRIQYSTNVYALIFGLPPLYVAVHNMLKFLDTNDVHSYILIDCCDAAI